MILRRHLSTLFAGLGLGFLVLTGARAGPAPIRFNTNFEGGSLGRIERVGDDAFRCHVKGQQDEHGRNRQASWYFFRIDGAKGREVIITLTDFVGEYNGRPGAVPMGPDILPVSSDDGETLDDRSRTSAGTIAPRRRRSGFGPAGTPSGSPISRPTRPGDWPGCSSRSIAATTPGSRSSASRRWGATCTWSRSPRPASTTARRPWSGSRPASTPGSRGPHIVMEGALRFVTSDDPKARALRRRTVFLFTPMVDPDGCATGQVRFNANGFDVNRHWDEVDLRQKRYLAEMPEIWYVKRAIVSRVDSGRPIHLMINLHNTETGEYLSTMADDPASRAIAGALSDRLVRETSFRPHRGPVLGERRDGSANVLHQEKGILIFLMEQRIAKDPTTGRPPSVEGRLRFGEQLIAIMAETARP